MCMSTPKVPTPKPLQEVKMPSSDVLRRKRPAAVGGSLLTGPGGVAGGALTTGATTLLGG